MRWRGFTRWATWRNKTGGASAPTADALIYRGATTADGGFGFQLPINVVADVEDGDQLLLGVGMGGGNSPVPSVTGWTLVDSVVGPNGIYVFKRTANSEPASYTVNYDNFCYQTAGMVAFYSGTARTVVVEASQDQTNAGASTSQEFPSIAASANATLCCFAVWGEASTATPPSGMTERYDLSSTQHGNYCATVTVSAGATGARTATSVASTTSKVVSVAIVETV